jgi:hypothetical protein
MCATWIHQVDSNLPIRAPNPVQYFSMYPVVEPFQSRRCDHKINSYPRAIPKLITRAKREINEPKEAQIKGMVQSIAVNRRSPGHAAQIGAVWQSMRSQGNQRIQVRIQFILLPL